MNTSLIPNKVGCATLIIHTGDRVVIEVELTDAQIDFVAQWPQSALGTFYIPSYVMTYSATIQTTTKSIRITKTKTYWQRLQATLKFAHAFWKGSLHA